MTRQGQVLAGRYELGPLLGVGGMASVYQATDRALERTVAVKVLGPPYDQDPALVERFRQEARVAAGLSHPNIVAVFDSGSEAGVHYLVMEYVQGETLAETVADTLRRHGALAPCWAAEVGRWVCQALGAAHARGLVHRDIKPANVLVSRTGQVKVADFGIASAAATASFTGGRVVLGTAAYLSPEQARGGPVDARSDVYALGCVLYELLTGAPPFGADGPLEVGARQAAQTPAPPSRCNPQVGPELDAVVMTALQRAPARRYQTVWAMGQDLERIAAGGGGGAVGLWPAAAGPATQAIGSAAAGSGSAPTVVVPTRAARHASRDLTRAARRWPRRARWPLAAGVGLVVLLVVALGWLRGGGSVTVAGQAEPPAATSSTAVSTSTATTTPRGSQPSLSGSVGQAAQGGHGGRALGHDRSGRRAPAAPGRGCHARCPRGG
jgi:eukaryotic-like serine/threonine-protein kinase